MWKYILISDNGKWVVKDHEGNFILWDCRTTPAKAAYVWTIEQKEEMWTVQEQWERTDTHVYQVRIAELEADTDAN